MSQPKGAKNSPKPAAGPAFNIEQIKQALKSAERGGGKGDLKLDEADAHFKPTSAAVVKRLNALKNEQLKYTELEAKFFEEMHALECKYHALYEPIFEKRRQIVSGEYEPSAEEAKWALDLPEANGHADEDKKDEAEAGKDEKGIPNFWLETLQSLRMTSELVQEADEPILAYLQDIRVKYFEKQPYGYTLEFHFAENPYFTNQVLTKTYELKIEVDNKDPFSFEGPDLDKVIGCKIDWKAGKNVTVKLIKKKLKSKNKKVPPKVITKEEKQDSFFNFFDTPKSDKNNVHQHENQVAIRKNRKSTGSEHDEHADEDDEEDTDDIFMFADFEIAQQIREKVVPKAVLYFTGELYDMDDDEDYDDYDDDEDEDGDDDDEHDDEDEDEDEDDDDHDDEDDGAKKGGKGGKKHGAGGKAPAGGKGAGGKHGGAGGKADDAPTPSECKQN